MPPVSTLRGRKPRVCHVITNLSTGGAEMMLYKLLTARAENPFETLVISMVGEGTIGPRLVAAGQAVQALGMARGIPSARGFLALRRMIADFQPDVVQGWMYHANLAATFAAGAVSPRLPVLWNIRQTVYRLGDNSRATAAVIRTGALLSRLPREIVYNSHASLEQHRALGYATRAARVIPNGFDLARFRPDAGNRDAVRRELGIPGDAPLVGMVARFDPMKDFPTMLAAMARVVARVPAARLVMAGRDVTSDNAALLAMMQEVGVAGHVHLLGEVADTPRLMSALDVLASSSAWGEGFPNVLGEAMACGVPCVATDVGDSRYIIDDTGTAVAPRDATALGDAIAGLLEREREREGRAAMGRAARARIAGQFSLERVVEQYDALYHAACDDARRSRSPRQR